MKFGGISQRNLDSNIPLSVIYIKLDAVNLFQVSPGIWNVSFVWGVPGNKVHRLNLLAVRGAANQLRHVLLIYVT